MTKTNILNICIDKDKIVKIIEKIDNFIRDDRQHYIVTVNPEIILKSLKNDEYRAIINNADIVTPDGFGIILASIILNNPIYQRITGVELGEKIFELSEKNNYKIFLLGAKNNFSQIAKTKLELKYKDIKIVGTEEGFTNINNITESENNDIIEKIKNSGAQILFVSYGAPFQEKWIYKNLKKIPKIKLAIGVGGAIDFWAKKLPRAPKIMRKLGLEWLFRLFIEPNRINRIINAVIVFLYNVFKWKIHTLKPIRNVVVGVVINNENKVLVIDREYDSNYWQLPQGGIEKNESKDDAIIRELKEETGLNKLKILGRAKKTNSYYWPIEYKENLKKPYQKFCGQKQTIYFLKQTEHELPKLKEAFHKNYKWVNINELETIINYNRISCTKIVLEEINNFIK